MEQEHQKPFLISLIGQCSTHKKSKIYDCLEYLDCRAIDLVQYQYQIASEYLNINELVQISLRRVMWWPPTLRSTNSLTRSQIDKFLVVRIKRKNKWQRVSAEISCLRAMTKKKTGTTM